MLDETRLTLRLPGPLAEWLKAMKEREGSTVNFEIIRSIKERKANDERKALIDEARILFGERAAAELAAKLATTGDNLAGTAPAVARNDDRVGSAVAHQPRF